MLKFFRNKSFKKADKDLKVEIVGTSMKKEDDSDKLYVTYRIHVVYKGKEWDLLKRYSQFEELNNALETYAFISMKQAVPRFPSKSVLQKKLSSKLIKKRREGLEKYLKQLIDTKDYANSSILLSFLRIIRDPIDMTSMIRDAQQQGKKQKEVSVSNYAYSKMTSSVRNQTVGDDKEEEDVPSGSESDEEWRRWNRRSPSSVPPMPSQRPPSPPPGPLSVPPPTINED